MFKIGKDEGKYMTETQKERVEGRETDRLPDTHGDAQKD